MELRVNGNRVSTQADPERLLLYVLRNELGLTGTKYGCGEGECGACTVLLDGVPARSCQIRVSEATAKEITTIEGVAVDGKLHQVQEAFIECDAMQCGYCTPGMIVASVAFLRKNAMPTNDQIRNALQGHICRCGTYNRIVMAVAMASRNRDHHA
jgi:aerobic-type carbon monoxide dehydrogenase small subunit (CoxS/CutS family)